MAADFGASRNFASLASPSSHQSRITLPSEPLDSNMAAQFAASSSAASHASPSLQSRITLPSELLEAQFGASRNAASLASPSLQSPITLPSEPLEFTDMAAQFGASSKADSLASVSLQQNEPLDFRFTDLVDRPKSHALCKKGLIMVKSLLENELFKQAFRDISVISRQTFKDVSQEGCVWFPKGMPKDIGNVCMCTLVQLCWHCAQDPSCHTSDTLNLMRVVAERYPSLSDRHLASKPSIELKGDVIEYALALSRFTGPGVPPQWRHQALHLNSLLVQWNGLWWDIVKIIAGHWGFVPPAGYLPAPRNMAKLIALSAVADELHPTRVQIAFHVYARKGW